MTNKPKKIGTAAEVAVVDYLKRAGYDPVRVALSGVNDLGDVHYTNARGRLVVVSVKGGAMAEKASPEQVAKWCGEVEHQRFRAGGHWCYVVTKRAAIGAPRAELWRAHAIDYPSVGVWSTDLATMASSLL